MGARRDNKVALVDFDKLAWMDNSPPGTFGHNWHYQVKLVLGSDAPTCSPDLDVLMVVSSRHILHNHAHV